jgi:hypothetical protein
MIIYCNEIEVERALTTVELPTRLLSKRPNDALRKWNSGQILHIFCFELTVVTPGSNVT